MAKQATVIEVAEQGSVTVVTLANPPVNAWTDELVDGVGRVVADLQSTRQRAVVITGQGGHFSAGGDFHRFQQIHDEAAARTFVTRVQSLMDEVAAIPVPV